MCGTGVASLIDLIWMPLVEKPRKALSRPAPTPRIITDASLRPISAPFSPISSPTLVAAYGVDLRAPEKPSAPAELESTTLPLSSVRTALVLLKVASMWRMPFS